MSILGSKCPQFRDKETEARKTMIFANGHTATEKCGCGLYLDFFHLRAQILEC